VLVLPREPAPKAEGSADMSPGSLRVVAVVVLGAFGFAPFVRAETPETAGPAAASSAPDAASTSKRKDFTDDVPCTACHNTSAWRAQGASEAAQKFHHSTTGVPLTARTVH